MSAFQLAEMSHHGKSYQTPQKFLSVQAYKYSKWHRGPACSFLETFFDTFDRKNYSNFS